LSRSPLARDRPVGLPDLPGFTRSIDIKAVRAKHPNAHISESVGGTIYATTPGGTKIVYRLEQLLLLAESPLSKDRPVIMAEIPGVTRSRGNSETSDTGTLPSTTSVGRPTSLPIPVSNANLTNVGGGVISGVPVPDDQVFDIDE